MATGTKRTNEALCEPAEPMGIGLCCMCSCNIVPNPAMMCVNCLKAQVDATEGIQRQSMLPHCGTCDRWLRGTQWINCDPESRELLGICLQRIKGLNKVKLVDANFIYTEEHSKRLKVKLQVQKEVMNGAIMQQSALIEFVVQNLQCEDCMRSFTPHSWKACVQVRQHADHKRTLFWLEQLIIKHDAHDKVLFITERPDGLDFHFNHRSHATSFSNFIASALPCRSKLSKHLVSQDHKDNTANFKYTILQELVSVSRDDLVFLPKAVTNKKGGGPQLLLCHKISTGIHCMNVTNLNGIDVSEQKYWKTPFYSVAGRHNLTEFVILDILDDVEQPEGISKHFSGNRNRFRLIDVEIARKEDLGINDERVIVRTHLGKKNKLRVGDIVAGYDLRTLNITGPEDDEIDKKTLPDVILTKRIFKRNRGGARKWELKRLDMHMSDKKDDVAIDRYADEKDYEDFKRDIEDDVEMRKDVLMFKNPFLKERKEDIVLPDNVHGMDEIQMESIKQDTATSSAQNPDKPKAAKADPTAEDAAVAFKQPNKKDEKKLQAEENGILPVADSDAEYSEDDDDAPEIDLAELIDGLDIGDTLSRQREAANAPLPEDSDDDL